MVRSDLGCSGVGFTLEPESGFRDVILLSGVYGLGETIVQGTVVPDEFYIFKPTLLQGKQAIIRKKLGDKASMLVYSGEAGAGDSTITQLTLGIDRDSALVAELGINSISFNADALLKGIANIRLAEEQLNRTDNQPLPVLI